MGSFTIRGLVARLCKTATGTVCTSVFYCSPVIMCFGNRGSVSILELYLMSYYEFSISGRFSLNTSSPREHDIRGESPTLSLIVASC